MTVTHQYDYEERPEVLSSVPVEAARILDVGCSRGGFGAALRRSGRQAEVWGIDGDPAIAAEASTHYDRFLTGFYPDALAGLDAQFDCIVFNDVLEHMVDPWSTLRGSEEHLSEDGVLVASIPNVRYFPVVARLAVQGDFTYVRNGVLDRTHLRFFTKRTMRDLFESSGYEVTELRGIAPWRGRDKLAAMLPGGVDDMAFRQFVVTARRRDVRNSSTSEPIRSGRSSVRQASP